MINWDRTVTETGTPSPHLADVTVWLWIHNASILLPSSYHQPSNIKLWQLITGCYPQEKENQWQQCIWCSSPQLKYTLHCIAKPERGPSSALCVFYSNESAPAPMWQLAMIYRESGESISSLQGILHNHKRAWQVTWARIYILLRDIDMQRVYMEQAGKTLKTCQLSRYFAHIMTNTGSLWTLGGYHKLPKMFMRQVRVMH